MKEPLDNISSIYTVKVQLKSLLDILEMNPTDSFIQYPSLFIAKLEELEGEIDDILG